MLSFKKRTSTHVFPQNVQQELILSTLSQGYHKVLGVSLQSEAFKGLKCPIKCWIVKPCLSKQDTR